MVHIPFGAYPTACYGAYDYDPKFLKTFARAAKDDAGYADYLDTYIHSPADHRALLEMVGKERLAEIAADPRTGYAANIERG